MDSTIRKLYQTQKQLSKFCEIFSKHFVTETQMETQIHSVFRSPNIKIFQMLTCITGQSLTRKYSYSEDGCLRWYSVIP